MATQDYTSEIEDDFSLKEILGIFYKNIKFITTVSSCFLFISILLALSWPNIYESSALLKPVESGTSSRGSSFSSLSSVVGMSLGKISTEGGRTETALVSLRSRDFFLTLYQNDQFLGDFYAHKGFSAESGYDASIYNLKEQVWLDVSKPLFSDAHKEFNVNILSLSRDETNGFITLSVKHQSPELAQKWTSKIISNINLYIKNLEVSEAEKRLEFLVDRLKGTSTNVLIAALSKLIEGEIKTLMLGESSNQFVFKVIDSPYISDIKVEPNRTLICFIGLFLGIFFAISVVLVLHYLGKTLAFSLKPLKIFTKEI